MVEKDMMASPEYYPLQITDAPLPDVYELLNAMETFDPAGERTEDVTVPPVVVRTCWPYIDAGATAKMSVHNPTCLEFKPATYLDLGTVKLTAPLGEGCADIIERSNERGRQGRDFDWMVPESVVVTYIIFYGSDDNFLMSNLRGLYLQRQAHVKYVHGDTSLTGSVEFKLSDIRIYGGISPAVMPSSSRRGLLSRRSRKILPQSGQDNTSGLDDPSMEKAWLAKQVESEVLAIAALLQSLSKSNIMR